MSIIFRERIMALIIAPFLFIAAVIYVAYPLLQEQSESETVDKSGERDRWVAEKEETLSALKDIEMDFRMGKLSQEDYENLKADFETRAVAVFQHLEKIEKAAVRGRKR
jgi:hypothetical protein